MCCIISVVCSTKCHVFHNFTFFCSNNTFFLNHVVKCKFQPCCLKVISTLEMLSRKLNIKKHSSHIADEIVLNGIVTYHSDEQNSILKFKNTDW